MTQLPSELERLRDKMAHESEALHVPYQPEIVKEYQAYRRGFDACYSTLLERAEMFDEKAAIAQYKGFETDHPAWGESSGFYEGARWQHSQDSATIQALREENARLEAIIDALRAKERSICDVVAALRKDGADE